MTRRRAATGVCIAVVWLTGLFGRPLAAEIVQIDSDRQYTLAQAAFEAG